MRFSVSRALVTIAAALFGAIGLATWVAPDLAAHRFGLEAVRAAGTLSLRADLGGLFVGLALLCAMAAWTRSRAWAVAAALVLSAVAAGRSIGWLANAGGREGLAELAVEAAAIAALVALARRRPTPPEAVERSRRWRTATAVAGALVVVTLAGSIVAVLNANVAQRIFDRAAGEMSGRVNTAPLVDDAMRVAVCGSSAPLPSEGRAKACVAVFAGGKFYIVDAGPESVENLVRWGVPLSSIGGVLLTHFHSDHIGDLGELQLQTWAGGRPAPLAVYGGPGVDRVVDGFNAAYQMDQGYRTTHHGERVMPSAAWGMVARGIDLDGAPTPAKDRTGLVLDNGDLRITAIEVDHAPIEPAYAYRFDYKGRSVVITGDLKYHPPLARAAKGADILVSEAIALSMTRALQAGARSAGRDRTAAIMHDIEDYHITPEQAATIANDAGVKLLVYYHLLPAPDGLLPRRLFAQGVNDVRRGDWTIADDGSLYTLPIGSRDVQDGRIAD
jgi:ribonuclease Z